MIAQSDSLAGHRETVLVASGSAAFVEIVGYMVRRCGLVAAPSAAGESASLSLTRTQARLVICDGDLPDIAVSRMMAEVAARRIPLIVSTPYNGPDRDAAMLHDVQRISFPLGQKAFELLISDVLRREIAQGGHASELGATSH